jgi:hypothetical protein
LKRVIDINVSSKAWRTFLESQSKEYPDYFEDPFSEAAMSYFKEMLEQICLRAIEHKSCSGLHSFVQSVKHERTRALMFTWLDTYSPIRQIKTKNGVFQQEVIRDFVPLCSMIEGKVHPYFSLNVRPRKTHKVGRKNLALNEVEVDGKSMFDTSRAASSDLELAIKMAKIAFNQFIRDRSLDSRKNLVDKINLIPIGQIERKGKPFLQGGAPGLGKK